MKIKITGLHINGHKYEGLTPKESLTEAEANSLLSIWEAENLFVLNDLQEYVAVENTSTSDGSPLNFGTLEAVLIDDEIIAPVKRARFLIALRRMNALTIVKDFVHVLNGESELWFDEAEFFNYYDPRLKAAEIEIIKILPTFTLKELFTIANSIQ